MATIKTRYNCSNWLRKQRNRVDPIKSAGCWTKKQPAKVPSKANHKPSQHLQQQPKLRVGAKKNEETTKKRERKWLFFGFEMVIVGKLSPVSDTHVLVIDIPRFPPCSTRPEATAPPPPLLITPRSDDTIFLEKSTHHPPLGRDPPLRQPMVVDVHVLVGPLFYEFYFFFFGIKKTENRCTTSWGRDPKVWEAMAIDVDVPFGSLHREFYPKHPKVNSRPPFGSRPTS